jgi:hypothetical protein
MSNRTLSSHAASAPTGKDAPPRRAPRRCHSPGLEPTSTVPRQPVRLRRRADLEARRPSVHGSCRNRRLPAMPPNRHYECLCDLGGEERDEGTSTAVLRAPNGRIPDTSCRASRNARVARLGRPPARRSAPAAGSAPDPAPCSPATARAPAARRAWRPLATIARRCRRRTAECSPSP